MSYIEFKNVTKEYGTEGNKIKALNNVNFSIEKVNLQLYLELLVQEKLLLLIF